MNADDATGPSAGLRLLAGRYEVAEVIGRGGTGEVRAGWDRRLERDVAVKFLRPEMAHQPDVRQRFEDEARLAARLVHPHVVAVFDTGEEAGIPYLVMERLSGRTLGDAIAAGPLPPEDVTSVGLQILDALSAAHAAGMVHRDVKPGNVLATTPGCWKVADFGIAKSLEVSSDLTMVGMVIGTPGYLAPERLAGAPAAVASDLYATGVVLYEALVGRRLAAAPSAAGTLAPADVRQVRPDVPPGLAGVVMRAMAPDPSDRFATAAEMAAALASSRRAGDATRVMPSGPALDDTVLALPPRAPAGAGPGRRQRLSPATRQGIAAVLVLLILVAAGLIVIGRRGGSHPASAPPASTTPAAPGASTPQPGASVPAPLDAALKQLERDVRP